MNQQDMTTSSAKLLISACLLGDPVRFDAQSKPIHSKIIHTLKQQGRLIKACPETLGGLPTPRPAAEINHQLIVTTHTGIDVTHEFQRGAAATLAICLEHNIRIAVLTEKSPSCGSQLVYDGSFQRHLIDGEGVTTRLLRKHGILVFNQFELEQAHAALLLIS